MRLYKERLIMSANNPMKQETYKIVGESMLPYCWLENGFKTEVKWKTNF